MLTVIVAEVKGLPHMVQKYSLDCADFTRNSADFYQKFFEMHKYAPIFATQAHSNAQKCTFFATETKFFKNTIEMHKNAPTFCVAIKFVWQNG